MKRLGEVTVTYVCVSQSLSGHTPCRPAVPATKHLQREQTNAVILLFTLHIDSHTTRHIGYMLVVSSDKSLWWGTSDMWHRCDRPCL